MKTLSAILAHLGVAAAQAVVQAVPPVQTDPQADGYAKLGIQAGLLLLHGFIAIRNSRSDPKGMPLTEASAGGFYSQPQK